ncbi:MAG: hypothetical protein HC853_01360 [Anaerolineae bacterium]|nr:hypothetical protein [Anaerolineae bacterium]
MKSRPILSTDAALLRDIREGKLLLRQLTAHKDTKVPVMLQRNAEESGSACLAMVLRHYGHDISLQNATSCARMGVATLKICRL